MTYPNTAAGPFDMGGLSHLTFRLDLCCVVIDGGMDNYLFFDKRAISFFVFYLSDSSSFFSLL